MQLKPHPPFFPALQFLAAVRAALPSCGSKTSSANWVASPQLGKAEDAVDKYTQCANSQAIKEVSTRGRPQAQYLDQSGVSQNYALQTLPCLNLPVSFTLPGSGGALESFSWKDKPFF